MQAAEIKDEGQFAALDTSDIGGNMVTVSMASSHTVGFSRLQYSDGGHWAPRDGLHAYMDS